MNRLFEIIYLLLEKKSITAVELAKHFEVSVRTIYRDIEKLSEAGIPVYTTQGKYGGISLLDNFVLNKMMVSEEEQMQIISALQSIKEVEKGSSDAAVSRLSTFFQKTYLNWVSVDFSDWSNQRQVLFVQVKHAILKRHLLCFDYYNSCGQMARRVVEPLQLWFKGKTWYLRAYCRERQAMRVFKLTRMKRVECLEESFDAGKHREGTGGYCQTDMMNETEMIKFVLQIDKTQTYRIYDDFEEEEIQCNDDGSFTVTVCYQEDEWVYGLILSYGCHARVLEPEGLKSRIAKELKKMMEFYL